ncbi:MAG: Phosphotransferase System HPr (HPr) Family [Herbinix sp.]|jgi:phosphocarrier protein|nr:Phosphotransferase System HPr (HPr) Family [Herbinix sp.]
MVSNKLIIDIPAGLHLRPISVLCNRSIDFKSTITIVIGDKSVNAKSVLGVLSACVKHGDEIELVCEGPDEVEALTILSNMIRCGLGDEFIKK